MLAAGPAAVDATPGEPPAPLEYTSSLGAPSASVGRSSPAAVRRVALAPGDHPPREVPAVRTSTSAADSRRDRQRSGPTGGPLARPTLLLPCRATARR